MTPTLIALALFLQGQPAADAAPAAEAPPPPAEAALPAGAPKDDYQFVAWCYGSLRAYLDLHDKVMPEVTRIESTYRPPNRKLSDDMKVYEDLQKEGRAQLKTFQAAMTAAEKASLKPINQTGAKAVAQGRNVWRASAEVTPARLAQEWMSWALPARCETTAKTLHDKATLMGASFKVNDQPADDTPPAADAAPPADAPKPPPASDPANVLLAPAPDPKL